NPATINYSAHENVEKDRQGQTDAAGNHAGFDFLIASRCRGYSLQTAYLQLSTLGFLAGHKHFSHPGLAPIEFLIRLSRVDDFAHGKQIRTTRFAKLQLFGLADTTSWTIHRTLREIFTQRYDTLRLNVLTVVFN